MLWLHSREGPGGESEWAWVPARGPWALPTVLWGLLTVNTCLRSPLATWGCLGYPLSAAEQRVSGHGTHLPRPSRRVIFGPTLRPVLPLPVPSQGVGSRCPQRRLACWCALYAPTLSPSHFSVPPLEFPRATSWINYMHPSPHFRIPLVVVQSLSHVWFLRPHGFPVHGISKERIVEWAAISFSRGSFPPRDWTWVSCITGEFFTIWTTREAPGYLWEDLKTASHLVKIQNRFKEWREWQLIHSSETAFSSACLWASKQDCKECIRGTDSIRWVDGSWIHLWRVALELGTCQFRQKT